MESLGRIGEATNLNLIVQTTSGGALRRVLTKLIPTPRNLKALIANTKSNFIFQRQIFDLIENEMCNVQTGPKL